jgi:hypothetical protein
MPEKNSDQVVDENQNRGSLDITEGKDSLVAVAKKDDRFDSVVGAFDEVERLIGWLGYIRENEYSPSERKRLISSAKRFAEIAQPIASKHLD